MYLLKKKKKGEKYKIPNKIQHFQSKIHKTIRQAVTY